ncbi:MerR family transcriptional regulator [Pseudokineococcus basanitobsidens]|uniref:MerR family transcriptional regulator n=1 Tax=Pseudokineococcus basanitobsidens TaxID=1926649 RepID=A0ABU8RJ91_9ACTN
MSAGASRRSLDDPQRGGAAGGGRLLSIGELLGELVGEFPEISHSKIRFLEEKGLVEPRRTPAGYRKFTTADVRRLRTVLALQRDHYMPLKAIAEHLDALDRGLEPAQQPGPPVLSPRAVPDVEPDRLVPQPRLRLRRPELREAAAVDEQLLADLEGYGLVTAEDGHYGADDLEVARAAGELAAYGIEARHLRAFRTAAERELGLVDQVVAPLRRHPSPGAGARAADSASELAALCLRLHTALVRAGLDRLV